MAAGFVAEMGNMFAQLDNGQHVQRAAPTKHQQRVKAEADIMDAMPGFFSFFVGFDAKKLEEAVERGRLVGVRRATLARAEAVLQELSLIHI